MAKLDVEAMRLAIQKLARRIRNNRGDQGISDSQLSVLFHLEAHPGSTPSSLAEREHVSPPSMNRTLNALEDAGLVRRSPDTDDARKVIIALTEQAHELLVETRRLRVQWFSARVASLTPEERAALAAAAPVLQKLAEE